jgi:hypothetical protein
MKKEQKIKNLEAEIDALKAHVRTLESQQRSQFPSLQAQPTGIGYTPPICFKHSEQMVLNFYPRPGSPLGNGWVCRTCSMEFHDGVVPGIQGAFMHPQTEQNR